MLVTTHPRVDWAATVQTTEDAHNLSTRRHVIMCPRTNEIQWDIEAVNSNAGTRAGDQHGGNDATAAWCTPYVRIA
jgi:hypothetical protein